MTKKKGGPWWMLAAAHVVLAFACGCAGQEAANDDVNHGDSLVSEEGQIAFTRIAK